MKITLPYGNDGMEISLPAENVRVLYPPPPPSPMPDDSPPAAALENPIGAPPLREMLRGKKSALVAITDRYRSGSYQKELLKLVLAELQGFSIRPKVLIARGTHFPAPRDEWANSYGAEAVGNYEFFLHDPHVSENLVELGKTEWGDPVVINRLVLEADAVISIGVIRPAARSGYSGGAKIFAVGAAGYPTIISTHTSALYFHPRSVVGNYQDHPFRERILAIARKAEKASRAGKFFSINAVQHADGKLTVFAGDMDLAWKKACASAESLFEVFVPEAADILVCGGGAPSDDSPYAFTSLLNNVCMTNPAPLLKAGGVLIALAGLREKPKPGSMDEGFLKMIGRIPYPQAAATVAEIEGRGQAGSKDFEGIHRFMAVAMLHQHTGGKIYVVGSQNPETVEKLGFIPFATFPEALRQALQAAGPGANILVAPNLSSISPCVGKKG